MGKKDKKKGKGAEKTAAKTEKKQTIKLKKELQKLGEEDIETVISQLEKEEQKKLEVIEKVIEAPSRRLNFSFLAHPDKDQLILFGGEFFDGQKTLVYNDLFFYNISSNTWTVVKAPGAPPPRCSHQMIATATNKGQLWLFGGEFVSASQSQFYHYRDLWVYHIATKKWEKIRAPNGPSARSGHRMVYIKKQLIVFGGFHDNLRDCKYFNDVYSFNIESYEWKKLEPVGTAPAPRSACCMVALNDGRVLIYGGYSKQKIKKDFDKGQVFTDAFLLTPDKNDPNKWKWVQIKIGGASLSPRCSMPITATPNNTYAYVYGGVFDVEDDEEELKGVFYDDFYSLDLEKLTWKNVTIGKIIKEIISKEDMEVEKPEATTIADDGVFKVTLAPSVSSPTPSGNLDCKSFRPCPRINSGLAIKHGILYLYGGMFEDGDKQITFSDFYSLDLKKLEEWKSIIKDETATQEWLGSDEESEESSSSEMDVDD